MSINSNTIESLNTPISVADGMINTCNGCGVCKKECAFLAEYGNPGEIACLYKEEPDRYLAISFECSLCSLCTSMCPWNFDPSAMFLDFRREAFEKGQADFAEHRSLLNYEKRGTSQKYTFYTFPENCNVVFFPGCTLTGTRPHNTLKTYEYLKQQYENIGIVLDCCTKPSHDLGRQAYFNDMFSEMKSYLLDNGIKTVIVACPNCHNIFNTYGKEFKVETIYEVMFRCGFDDKLTVSGRIALHDPCPVRFQDDIQESVRSIVRERGLDIIETPHEKRETLCCGEGGAVGCISPGYARKWMENKVSETDPEKIISYCAGCVNMLSQKADAFHILDLVFAPDKAISKKACVSKAPFTYLNRLNIKRKLKKYPAKTVRERTFSPLNNHHGRASATTKYERIPILAGWKFFHIKKRKNTGLKLLLAVFIIAIIAGIRAMGI